MHGRKTLGMPLRNKILAIDEGAVALITNILRNIIRRLRLVLICNHTRDWSHMIKQMDGASWTLQQRCWS
jgi:hypothetical protein